MKRISILLLAIVCLVIGFTAKTGLENEVIAQFFRTYAPWIGAVAVGGLLLLGVVLVTGYLYARHRLRRLLKAETPLTEAQIATGLVDMLTTPEGVADPTPAQRQRALLVNGGTWLMRRQATQFYFNATVTVMGGLIGTATLFLLYEQNQKIDLQNEKITLQTDASIVQSVLLEGARRANLAGELTALQADVRQVINDLKSVACDYDRPRFEGCWEGMSDDIHARFILPIELAARIDGFLRRSTPYRLAISNSGDIDFQKPLGNQYDFPELSPERGQILETLARNKVSLRRTKFDFTRAHLASASLDGAQLGTSRLNGANLQGAFLREANLTEANMAETNLIGADLYLANLQGADLTQADLRSAYLNNARLKYATLMEANLRGSFLGGSDLFGADFTRADLRGAAMGRTNLLESNFSGANLGDVQFSETQMLGLIYDGKTVWDGAWAWSDLQPQGVPDGIEIKLCEFDADNHNRLYKPDDCGKR